MKEPLKLLELFGGIGACSKALERIGINYEIADYVEIDKFAVKSYNAMHGTDFEPQDITEWNKDIDVDLIMHGSPCTDFSLAGKQLGGDKGSGTRSSLMYETIRIVNKLKPKYVIWENVKNLLSKKHRHNFDTYLETMEQLGYKNYYQVLNAKDYGIPQNRERVFTISIFDGESFEFPAKKQLELRLMDVLEDEVDEKYYIDNDSMSILLSKLHGAVAGPTIVASRGRNPNNPSDRTVGSPTEQRLEPNTQGITNTLTTVQKDNLVLEKIVCEQRTDEGLRFFKGGLVGTLRTIDGCGDKRVLEPNKLKLHTNLSGGKWDKMHESARRVYDEEGIAPTIPTCGGGNIEPKVQTNYRIRKLTPKECWRLMGFDDADHEKAEKVNSKTQLYKQAGNSIVVNVLEAIFNELFKSSSNKL